MKRNPESSNKMRGADTNSSGVQERAVIPSIDINGLVQSTATQEELETMANSFDEAMRAIGMVYLINHNISPHTIDKLRTSAKLFFDQPHHTKMESCLNKGYGHGGYVPQGVEAVARSNAPESNAPPDLVENLVFSHVLMLAPIPPGPQQL